MSGGGGTPGYLVVCDDEMSDLSNRLLLGPSGFPPHERPGSRLPCGGCGVFSGQRCTCFGRQEADTRAVMWGLEHYTDQIDAALEVAYARALYAQISAIRPRQRHLHVQCDDCGADFLEPCSDDGRLLVVQPAHKSRYLATNSYIITLEAVSSQALPWDEK